MAKVRFYDGGFLVELDSDGIGDAPPGGERGDAHFSKASRRRLLQGVAKLDQARLGTGLFVTLTYPGQWPAQPSKWKRDLDVWIKRLRYKHREVAGWWKLEPQQRGAPHFHLLLWGLERVCKSWLSSSWFEVVGSGDERHLRAGTQVQRMRSHRGAIWYAAKYLGKDVPRSWMSKTVGRWWGAFNRPALARSEQTIELTDRQFCRLRRVLRAALQKRGVVLPRLERCRGRKGWRLGCRAFLDGATARRLASWAASW